MAELTERQKLVLTLVIHEYIRTAVPVGSQHVVEHYRLDLSPATVRNEMAVLTELGYLRQPHTSAGRVPSEEGYRYFVGRLLQETELPDNTRRTISHQFYQMNNDVEQWMRLAASVLAHQSKAASLITAPHPDQAHIKHLELISTRGRQVLMVLVMAGGEIHQRIMTSNEPFSQEVLSSTANRLTNMFQGLDVQSIQVLRPQMQGFDQEVVDWIIDDMKQGNALVSGEVILDGLTNVLAEPEFAGSEEARRALHIIEERSLLQELLARTVPTDNIGGVQVLIGGEGTWDELRQFSVVLARYGTPGLVTGTLGVLGPMRMYYGRTISTVRYLSNLLSDLVSETLLE
ncbi:MAG TPA: heat-inducible transcriptional repressor HrcA [Anaerolineaceae bacterium]|nr:heat-inducible transcriptional repressor HrcA [Anaerolineaceae bacterium]